MMQEVLRLPKSKDVGNRNGETGRYAKKEEEDLQ